MLEMTSYIQATGFPLEFHPLQYRQAVLANEYEQVPIQC
jgi:hypothetical protein